MDKANEWIIRVEKITVNKGAVPILQDISFALRSGEHLAITGASGSGKTTLGLAIAGKIFYKGKILRAHKKMAWVEQQHHFKNLSNTSDFYYQQRFNSSDSGDAQTVKEVLTGPEDEARRVLKEMKIEYLADRPLIQLSNGENKKLQLAKALLGQPSVLIMDQPFVGLDTDTRIYLHDLINDQAKKGILFILIITPDEIPLCVTRVLCLEEGKMKAMDNRENFIKNYPLQKNMPVRNSPDKKKLEEIFSFFPTVEFTQAICMKKVNVEYAGKKILDDINWEVRKGERWLLSGPNGAGKSTLLSLVTADNPQAYANEIYLFDRKRGSGESIWDIKKKIGFLSPELHLFFDQGAACFEAVASGLFDTIGLFRQLSGQDSHLVREWIAVTGIERLQQKRLYELSIGEQRIVLLARALVKNPPLLVLDEPCQGLDKGKESELLELIDMVCVQGNKTMIFVTHYTNEIPRCIDHFIKLDNGRSMMIDVKC